LYSRGNIDYCDLKNPEGLKKTSFLSLSGPPVGHLRYAH
jgi:hypothetical protein